MYIINNETKIVDNIPESYRGKVEQVYGECYQEYTGNVVKYNNVLYAEGFEPSAEQQEQDYQEYLKTLKIQASDVFRTALNVYELNQATIKTQMITYIDVMISQGLMTQKEKETVIVDFDKAENFYYIHPFVTVFFVEILKNTQEQVLAYFESGDETHLRPLTDIEKFQTAQAQKLNEINNKYTYSYNYAIFPLSSGKLANRQWLNTWNEGIKKLESAGITEYTLRLYEPTETGKLRNVYIPTTVEQYKTFATEMNNYRFDVIQPKYNEYAIALQSATTIEEVNAIVVDFGLTLNEDDVVDMSLKIEL